MSNNETIVTDKEISKIKFLILCISEFATRKVISPKDAYLYLKKYGGFRFLSECYEAEHTLGLEDIMEDMKISIEEAFDILYNSKTFGLLCDYETGMYSESPGYVYEWLKEELDKKD